MRLDELDTRRVLRKHNDANTWELRNKPNGFKPFYKQLIGLLPYLEKNCSEILNVYKNTSPQFMYRGESNTIKLVSKNPHPMDAPFRSMAFKGQIRPTRAPVGNNEIWTQWQPYIADVMTDLGAEANRTNSIFCTGSADMGEGWGHLYMIFPADGFKYTWYKKLEPFQYSYSFLERSLPELRSRALPPTPENIELTKVKFANVFRDLGMKVNTGLAEAITGHKEIMVSGTSYYGLDSKLREPLETYFKDGLEGLKLLANLD